MAESRELHPAFRHREYLFRRVVFRVFEGPVVYDQNGNRILYSKVEISKSKRRPEFLVYSEGIQKEVVLRIESPKLLEIDDTFNIHDPATDKAVGTIKKKGGKSIVKDEWIFLSSEGEELGRLTERNIAGAFFRRAFSFIPVIGGIASIPAKYVIVSATGTEVAQIRQHFAPLVSKHSLTMVQLEPSIDRRLLVAAGILLSGH